MKISILISSYGDRRWEALASTRALPSAEGQGAHEVLVLHEPDATLAEVRNASAERATGTHLLFLDADDELAPGYCDAIAAAGRRTKKSLLTPAVQFVRPPNRRYPVKMMDEVPITQGNWLIIGTVVPRDLFLEVGRFREYIWSEDWSSWARCIEAGADVIKVPDAVYVAYMSQRSRNRSQSRPAMLYSHQTIGHDIWPHLYEAPTEQEHARQRLRTNHIRMLPSG